MTSAVEFASVTRHFGPASAPIKAVDGVNLTIAEGAFFAMLGPSGSGKTTCLRLISGFESPSSGVIRIFGEDVSATPPHLRNVNTVFQDYALFPHMNVRDNVALGLRMRGVDSDTRARVAADKLALVGLQDYAERAVYELSGGMQQRVGIARALASDPALLLMDEPMGALDAFTRETVQEILLRAWAKANKMVFFITHSVEEALFLATRLIVMSPSPGRITHAYDNVPFSREFLSHGDARKVKSEPEFIRMREEVLSIIHQREEAHV